MTLKIQTPKSWELPAFEELTTFIIGGDWGKDAEFSDPAFDDALCIRGAEFRNWDAEKGRTASLRKIKASSINTRRLQEGDILVEISGGGPEQPVGRTALIDKAVLSFQPETPKVCTNFLRLVRLTEHTYSSFVNYFLNFFYASGEVSNYQAGSNNLRNLKFNDYVGIGIPLPPLNEQHRIVAKIEELFSELEKGVESLKAAKAQLAVYRQSVLKAAFEGRLTEGWRKEHADKLELANELLTRIKAEREARYEVQLAEWQASGGMIDGKKAPKPKKPKEFSPLTADELAALPVLPEGWGWVKVEHLGDVETGTTPPKADSANYGNESPFYKPSDLEAGYNVHEASEYLSSIGMEHSRVLPENSILVTCIGATIGKTGICRVRGASNQQINSIIPHDTFDSNFIYFQAIGERFQRSIRDNASSTTLPILNKSKFSSLSMAVCSHIEQHQIVQEIEFRFSVVEKMEQAIEESLQKAEGVRQSILKRAFEGKLVPQDPTDEPASELLARIHAEWEGVSKGQKRLKRVVE